MVDPSASAAGELLGNVNPIGIRSCYDEGKGRRNALCDYHRQNQVDIRIVRIFNTYGPRMLPGTTGAWVSNLSQTAPRRGSYMIYGDGTQTRSLLPERSLSMRWSA